MTVQKQPSLHEAPQMVAPIVPSLDNSSQPSSLGHTRNAASPHANDGSPPAQFLPPLSHSPHSSPKLQPPPVVAPKSSSVAIDEADLAAARGKIAELRLTAQLIEDSANQHSAVKSPSRLTNAKRDTAHDMLSATSEDDGDSDDGLRHFQFQADTQASHRLCEAVAGGALAVVQTMVESHAAANALWDRTDGATLLHAAAFNGHMHVAKHLIIHRANVDRQMTNGATPIFAAAQRGNAAVLEELLQAGAQIDWMSRDASTPLYVAAWKGHKSVVARLLRAGAQADRWHRERATPLFVAAQEGHAGVVRVLLDAGADPRRKWQDVHGRRWTAVDKAVANRHAEVVELLISST